MIKNDLERSISDLENFIKIFKRTTKDNEKECYKINNDNEKLITTTIKNREKNSELDLLKNDDIFMKYNFLYNEIKKQTIELNKEILYSKNEIDEINNYIKRLNKNIFDDSLECDKLRKDINFYTNHCYNLKEKIKSFEDNADKVENIINKMQKDNSI